MTWKGILSMDKLKQFLKNVLFPNHYPKAEDGYEYYETVGKKNREDEWEDFLKYDKFPFIIRLFHITTIAHLIILLIRHIVALKTMNPAFLPGSALYTFFWMLIPPAIWIWSTAYEYWNFHNRKLKSLYLVYTNCLIVAASLFCNAIFNKIIKLVLLIPINKEVTQSMVVNLARTIIVLTSWTPFIVIWVIIHKIISEETAKANILSFKILRGKDRRKDKNFKYDFTAVKRMDDGKPQLVKEKDRTLHMAVSGATGTAKTSSVLTPSIARDLDQKRYNENFQKKACLKHVKQGEFRVKEEFNDEEFSINYFEPVYNGDVKEFQKRQERFNYLKLTAQSAGITVVAPTDAFADEIYNLAINRGMKVNRVDPMLIANDEHKPGFIGLNPLYVSPSLKGRDRDIAITNNANIFANVLKALYDLSGASDAYFVSVNNSITIALAKLLMLTFEDVHNRQPHPGDLQNCINRFQETKIYLDKLVEKYNKNKQIASALNSSNGVADYKNNERDIDCGIWQDVYTLVKYDLLSPDMGPKMYDRANGLRLQINEFMNHPLVRDVLCHHETLDIDKALANGEVTVVNYSLQLGQSVSLAFGLFFLLTYAKAVLRRPGTEDTRTLHLCYIDEFPVLLHPNLEEFFSLHRQFKAGNTVALQTYDQMDKNSSTKYLKSVMQGVGHQILFGRVSAAEMKLYEQMGGTQYKEEVQKSATETSITSEHPSYTYSKRHAKKEVSYVNATSLRYRDFQEVTFFTTQDNTPLRPIHGKVNFLKNSMKKGEPPIKVNWEPFYDEILKKELYERSIAETIKLQKKEDKNKDNTSFIIKTSYISTTPFTENKTFRFTASGEVVKVNKEKIIIPEPAQISIAKKEVEEQCTEQIKEPGPICNVSGEIKSSEKTEPKQQELDAVNQLFKGI